MMVISRVRLFCVLGDGVGVGAAPVARRFNRVHPVVVVDVRVYKVPRRLQSDDHDEGVRQTSLLDRRACLPNRRKPQKIERTTTNKEKESADSILVGAC